MLSSVFRRAFDLEGRLRESIKQRDGLAKQLTEERLLSAKLHARACTAEQRVKDLQRELATAHEAADALTDNRNHYARQMDRAQERLKESLRYIALALEDDPPRCSPARIVEQINKLRGRAEAKSV